MKPYAYCVLVNKFGEFSTAAVALRLGMTLSGSGNFVGWLTPDQVSQLREGGFAFKLTAFKFDE